MHLLLGNPYDPCCSDVRTALEAAGHQVCMLENLSGNPARLAWRFDGERSASELVWGDEPMVADRRIDGVLVRNVGWIDPAGWEANDLAYVEAETHAALLGWLWSLPCPVLNRYPAAMWYRPHLPFLSWRPLLWRCGLRSLETLVSNVEEEARAFAAKTAASGVNGAVYRPMTSDARYLIATEREWEGLAAVQLRTPVCLTAPHGQPQSAYVVGDVVVWDGPPPPRADALASSLRRFAAAAELSFVEVVLADVDGDPCVVGVEHHPRFDGLRETTRQAVVAGLVRLLTGAAVAAPS
jgi:hypothetical protein